MKPPVHKWLPTFCCAAPFVALIVATIGHAFGTRIESTGLIAVVLLCNTIIKCLRS
jgi:hypothetical protein